MPVKRSYESLPVKIASGGKLLPDLAVGLVGAANFREKINFVSDIGEVAKRAGWDFPSPTDDWLGVAMETFDATHPCEAIRGVRRPNGTYAVVAAGAGLIKAYNYSVGWVTIGSGFSTSFDEGFRWWQIEDIAGYAVFNNGRDLPVWWQIGDATVTPLYEMREAGYASVGLITEYVDGVLMCADVLEINDADMSAVMNDPLPYKTIVDSAITTRITFRRIWSNIGNPTDFAVTVPGSADAYVGPTELTLQWPMASFEVGDTVLVVGAGAAGGNLTTTIAGIAGNIWTLTDPVLTSVTDTDVQRPTDINSIAGYDDIEDDGSAIVMQIALKTQLMTFKASGHIWQTYYTGDLDTPFAKDRVTKKGGVAPRFPRAVVNVVNDNNEEYLLFPGAKHFYRLDLGSQAPQQEPLFMGAEKELFFSRIQGVGPYDVWAADNTCTDEIIFGYLWDAYEVGYYGATRAIALKYAKNCESLSEIDGFNFTCAASIQKPLSGFDCDEVESWFVMGAGDGSVTLYGETNMEVLTRRRYGETFEASLAGGLFAAANASDTGSYARRFSLDPSSPVASAATTVTIYGSRSPNDTPVALETKTLTDPRFPGCMGLYYRKPFFSYRLVSEADTDLRISGFIWRMGGAQTQDIDRLQ
jgi:hypothetical protein